MSFASESDLYPAIKALFQAQGYEVKGEVGAADVVACRGEAPPVIVELKLRFSLSLFHQAVSRLALSESVYVAVPRPAGKTARRVLRDNLALCRRLGLGLITVRADARCDVLCDPGAPAPRRAPRKTERLLREFQQRRGDPNAGGATRHGIVTTYRQDALRCAAHLAEHGPGKGAAVAAATGVAQATRLMRDNHYGWFARVSPGIYRLTPAGQAGLEHWAHSWEDG